MFFFSQIVFFAFMLTFNIASFNVVFRYKPWIGQLKIESTVYDVGLQSVSGAWFPAKLYVSDTDNTLGYTYR